MKTKVKVGDLAWYNVGPRSAKEQSLALIVSIAPPDRVSPLFLERKGTFTVFWIRVGEFTPSTIPTAQTWTGRVRPKAGEYAKHYLNSAFEPVRQA